MRTYLAAAVLMLVSCALGAAEARAQQVTSPSPAPRQSLDDAWWTGPMLAASAATLPRGHMLIEPYVYDVITPHTNGYGSLTYILYGLTDRFTVGVMPTIGYTAVANAPSAAGVGMGDTTLIAQYRLTQFHIGSWVPTTSVVAEESLPTGKYDQLGERPSDGLGSGAFTTTLGLYTQTYFWLHNGRILRARLDVTQAFSSAVDVNGVSVYGTGASFQGVAKPGSSFYADTAGEYSITRNWVAALDVTYRYGTNTHVAGNSVTSDSGASVAYGFAPALEYNWTPYLGVLLGTRVIPKGRNTPPSTTPAIAINFVH